MVSCRPAMLSHASLGRSPYPLHMRARCVAFAVTQASLAIMRHTKHVTSMRDAAVLLLRILLVAGSTVAGVVALRKRLPEKGE